MTAAEKIEDAFVVVAETATGVKRALDHEPGQEGLPSQLPCVTMLYLGARLAGEYTGAVDDLEHTWDVFLYVRLKDFKEAQVQLRDTVDALLAAMRPVVLAGSELSHLKDELSPPQLFREDGIAVKRLKLYARATAV